MWNRRIVRSGMVREVLPTQVGEGQLPLQLKELFKQLIFDFLRWPVGHGKPRDPQIRRIGELPDIPPAPVPNGLTAATVRSR